MPSTDVFITGLGSFFPGPPIPNDAIETVLGTVDGKPSRLRERVLRQNGIISRHYALDEQQRSRHSCRGMAAAAIRRACVRAGIDSDELDMLAAATTQADLAVPGFASQVHAELGGRPLSVMSLGGVCASGVAALEAAFLSIRAGTARTAVACASEFPSRVLKASQFSGRSQGSRPDLDREFLRFMLSDGAGAAVLTSSPRSDGLSLHVDWIRSTSLAHRQPLLMYAGARRERGQTGLGESWLDLESHAVAAQRGYLDLRQDVSQLDSVVQFGVEGFFALIDEGVIVPDQIDWLVCHYSSLMFRAKIQDLLRLGGCDIPQSRWFSNLSTRGNVGSASTFVLLDELVTCGRATPGQTIVVAIPESGGAIMAFAGLTVMGDGQTATRSPGQTSTARDIAHHDEGDPILQPAGPSHVAQRLVRDLTAVWGTFERDLRRVSILAKLEAGAFTLDDYRRLLVNIRQQVIDGGRWIARAASSLSIELFDLRSSFLGHAHEEHRDYQMLERDYVAVGGNLDEIRSAPKNIGSEALSAWMFHRASRENPVDLLGAMFIIEGLGQRMARRWADLIREQLSLDADQVSFLAYHGENDDSHLAKLEAALTHPMLDETIAAAIVKTAKVTARLYRLQLEEIDHV